MIVVLNYRLAVSSRSERNSSGLRARLRKWFRSRNAVYAVSEADTVCTSAENDDPKSLEAENLEE